MGDRVLSGRRVAKTLSLVIFWSDEESDLPLAVRPLSKKTKHYSMFYNLYRYNFFKKMVNKETIGDLFIWFFKIEYVYVFI